MLLSKEINSDPNILHMIKRITESLCVSHDKYIIPHTIDNKGFAGLIGDKGIAEFKFCLTCV